MSIWLGPNTVYIVASHYGKSFFWVSCSAHYLDIVSYLTILVTSYFHSDSQGLSHTHQDIWGWAHICLSMLPSIHPKPKHSYSWSLDIMWLTVLPPMEIIKLGKKIFKCITENASLHSLDVLSKWFFRTKFNIFVLYLFLFYLISCISEFALRFCSILKFHLNGNIIQYIV